jgi:hypothetical protein
MLRLEFVCFETPLDDDFDRLPDILLYRSVSGTLKMDIEMSIPAPPSTSPALDCLQASCPKSQTA